MRVAFKPSGLPGRTLVSRVSAILNQGEERKERIGGRRKERTLWVLRALSTTFYLGKPAAGPAAQSAPEDLRTGPDISGFRNGDATGC